MPSRPEKKTCIECGNQWVTRSRTARTCSPKCRAQVREREHGPTKGAAPRDYPPEVVDKVRSMYAAGSTIAEIQAEVSGAKVRNIMVRYGIERRKAVPRNQRGSAGHTWKGDSASYTAFHLRVQNERGKPQECSRCGANSPGRYEWANLTGNYQDVNDYQRMCVTCHRRFDAARRRATGMRTSPARR